MGLSMFFAHTAILSIIMDGPKERISPLIELPIVIVKQDSESLDTGLLHIEKKIWNF
jgi:hypothetical protein